MSSRRQDVGTLASWRTLIPDDDWRVYDAAGYGKGDLDSHRPALLIVDVTYGFVGDASKTLFDAIAEYPNACGPMAHAAVPAIRQVLESSRARGCPVFYTGGLAEQKEAHIGQWAEKHARFLEGPPDGDEIIAELRPHPEDIVIRKTKPSAFFGTPLTALLIERRIDALIITGCTTSGCIRASVIDAFSFGFQPVVVEDGVFDRSDLAHAVNLFDMGQKYAHVRDARTIVEYLEA